MAAANQNFCQTVMALRLLHQDADTKPMDVCDEIMDARDCGIVHCGIIESKSMKLADLASSFGLIFTPRTYQEISKAQAAAVARHILHRDLAYKVKLMAESKAQALANRFLDCFVGDDTQFYTNGNYYTSGPGYSWNPATAGTSATFDTGILVISELRAGCLWVEDED